MTCMKGSPEAEISSVVYAAKTEAIEVLQHGRSWEFGELQHIMEQPSNHSRMIMELQKRGNVLSNIPENISSTDVQQVRREVTRKRLRTHLMCPVCKNTSWSLPLHLRRVCLEGKSGADIKKLVTQAKHDANKFLRHGRMWEYRSLHQIMEQPEGFEKIVKELQRRGNVVRNIPSGFPSASWADFEDGTRQCMAVLGAAKSDFLGILRKLKNRDACPFPTSQELLMVLYYLEATVILCHLQRPAVVRYMTVSQWLQRIPVRSLGGHCVLAVKSADSKMVSFALNREEEMWFNTYYCEVRPVMLSKKKTKGLLNGDDSSYEKFFISSTGRPVQKPSYDLHLLYKKYQLPEVTSQQARKAFLTASGKVTNDFQKSLLADYLNDNTGEWDCEQTLMISQLLRTLTNDSDTGKERAVHTGPGCKRMKKQAAYDTFIRIFPVTLEGAPPRQPLRASHANEYDRQCYDQWRADQLQLRIQHIIEHFGKRQPSESKLRRFIGRQEWTSNVPDFDHVLKHWTRPRVHDSVKDNGLIQMVRSQKWKGLQITVIPGKNKGVVTTTEFACGDIVCDYHGTVVSRKEGLTTHNSTGKEDTGYMFFYQDKSGRQMCIDAHLERCMCHPHMVTYGRMINHSRNKSNLQPRLHSLDGNTDVILFHASRNIKKRGNVLSNIPENISSTDVQQVRREVTRKRLRTHLMCPVCKNTSWSLPLHLRRVCLEGKSGADIKKLVTQAKHDANKFLRHGRMWEYRSLHQIMEQPEGFEKIVKELQRRGNVVRNIPSGFPSASWADFEDGTRQCMAVLGAAKSDFLGILRKLKNRDACPFPTSQELLMVLYYLEATVILCHLQRPAVVRYMTVSQWLQRIPVRSLGGHCVLAVKSADSKMVSFALNREEEMWFNTYYCEVRPVMLSKKKTKGLLNGDDSSYEKFFISSTGRPVQKPSYDLHLLYKKYQLPEVTSQHQKS
ncbi:hypothetical protein MHYP_G00363410 [Metynnis hypsauchen]